MSFRAVLFDLDGTLLDTVADLADAANTALGKMGCPGHSIATYRRAIGDGMEMLARRILPPERCDAAAVARCVMLAKQEYSRCWSRKTRPFAGVAAVLDTLAARGLPMAVLSNKPDEFTQLCVGRLLGRWQFVAVLGQGPSVPTKPDPAGARQIAARLAQSPAEMVYLGDTDTDMRTAVAAGMFPAGALWGYRDREELLAHGAKALLQQPPDLLGLLGFVP
jgi:phosphoglycolate phosphatase